MPFLLVFSNEPLATEIGVAVYESGAPDFAVIPMWLGAEPVFYVVREGLNHS